MSDTTVNNFKAFYEQIRPYLGSAHSGFTPVGTVISVMGTTAPMNYLACDGTVYNIADYPELAAYFTAQFEAANYFGGDGTTTFAVPDLRGEFLRGAGTNSHANQGSGAAVGVHQDGTEHVFCGSESTFIDVGGNGETIFPVKQDSEFGTEQKANAINRNTTSGDNHYPKYTSRPTNTSVLYCIATKNIFMDAGMNYSTEEQVVGTWIDSKPIYQKTFIKQSVSNNSWNSENHGIQNIDKVVNVWGGLFNTENGGLNTGYWGTGGVSPFGNRTVVELYVSYGATGSQHRGFVTIQYTKTTDA